MLGEGNKNEIPDPSVGMQRACADQLEAVIAAGGAMKVDIVTEACGLLEQITPGEWNWNEEGIGSDVSDSPDCSCVQCRNHPRNYHGQILQNDSHYYAPTEQDGMFIIQAPRIVRALITEVQRLRDESLLGGESRFEEQ